MDNNHPVDLLLNDCGMTQVVDFFQANRATLDIHLWCFLYDHGIVYIESITEAIRDQPVWNSYRLWHNQCIRDLL